MSLFLERSRIISITFYISMLDLYCLWLLLRTRTLQRIQVYMYSCQLLNLTAFSNVEISRKVLFAGVTCRIGRLQINALPIVSQFNVFIWPSFPFPSRQCHRNVYVRRKVRIKKRGFVAKSLPELNRLVSRAVSQRLWSFGLRITHTELVWPSWPK